MDDDDKNSSKYKKTRGGGASHISIGPNDFGNGKKQQTFSTITNATEHTNKHYMCAFVGMVTKCSFLKVATPGLRTSRYEQQQKPSYGYAGQRLTVQSTEYTL